MQKRMFGSQEAPSREPAATVRRQVETPSQDSDIDFRKPLLIGGGVLAAAVVLTFMFAGGGTEPAVDAEQTATVPAPEVKKHLALHVPNFNCTNEYSFAHIRGEVKNNTDQPIDSLMVVGTYYTSDGTFVKSSSAMVEYQPLMPGQTSPFQTLVPNNPQMKECRIAFKTMFGPTIDFSRSGYKD